MSAKKGTKVMRVFKKIKINEIVGKVILAHQGHLGTQKPPSISSLKHRKLKEGGHRKLKEGGRAQKVKRGGYPPRGVPTPCR